MANFNKYAYLRNIEENIYDDILMHINVDQDFDEIYDEVTEYINQDIDNACIYYHNCFAIIMELNFTSFKAEDNDYGIDCGDVCQAAYVALREWVDEELDITKLIEDKMEDIK